MNPDTPKVVGICAGCGFDIVEGEYVYQFEGATFHTDNECVAEFFTNYHDLQEEVAEDVRNF